MEYPEQAKELIRLLNRDQTEWRNFAKADFEKANRAKLSQKQESLKLKVRHRAKRMLEILDEIDEPTISNIGTEAAQAISILATHDSTSTLHLVLAKFIDCYKRQPDNVCYQSIPSMTDVALILEHKSQRFGTIWLFDENKQPFLPTVDDFSHVNQRRTQYGIEPLHWPKSLAIRESQQPWLKRPLSEAVMRDPTDKEYNNAFKDYE
jgi:hypothetical protein